MTFALTPEQLEIRDAVARLCQRFGDGEQKRRCPSTKNKIRSIDFVPSWGT